MYIASKLKRIKYCVAYRYYLASITAIHPHLHFTPLPLPYKTIHTNSTLVRNLRANRLQNITTRLQQSIP